MDAPIVLSKSTVEPVSLDFARKHLKLVPEGSPLSHPDDELVTQYITVAREYVEEYTGLSIVPTVLELRLDEFPPTTGVIILPGAPVREVLSVAYMDSAGVLTVVDPTTYKLNAVPLYPTFQLAAGGSWPTPASQAGAVRITYSAGHTDNESPNNWPTPARLRHAILLMLTHWYENRSAVEFAGASEVPFSAVALMKQMQARRGLA